MILAIDFDLTIADTAYPVIHGLRKDAKKYIQKLHAQGHYIIIWTCRDGQFQQAAVDFLLENDIPFHQVNEHHPDLVAKYKNNTRKIAADLYIDDKCISGLPSWRTIYHRIQRMPDRATN